MGLLIIDESKCKKDGICASDCTPAIIRLNGSDAFPHVRPEDEAACTLCGHCVAACPHGALNHSRIPAEGCLPIQDDQVITHDQAVQFLRSRRSIRRFKDRAVERDKISRLIEIARYAPSSGNSQRVEWAVFTDRKQMREFAEMTVDCLRKVVQENFPAVVPSYLPRIVAAWDAGNDSVLRNAPVLIVASAPEEVANGMADVVLCLSYLDLAAPSMGLGTCWCGLVQRGLRQWPPLREAIGLPEGHTHHFPIMLGYPQIKYHRLPERKPPKIVWK